MRWPWQKPRTVGDLNEEETANLRAGLLLRRMEEHAGRLMSVVERAERLLGETSPEGGANRADE